MLLVLSFRLRTERGVWVVGATAVALGLWHDEMPVAAAALCGLAFLFNAVRLRRPRLLVGAVLGVYLYLRLFDVSSHVAPVDLAATAALLLVAWRFRLLLPLVLVAGSGAGALGWVSFHNSGQFTAHQWGLILLGSAFALLLGGVALNLALGKRPPTAP